VELCEWRFRAVVPISWRLPNLPAKRRKTQASEQEFLRCLRIEMQTTRKLCSSTNPPSHKTGPSRQNSASLIHHQTAAGGRADGAGRSLKDNPIAAGIEKAMAKKTEGSRTSRFLRHSRSWANLMRRSHSPQKPTTGSSISPPRTSSGIFGSLQKGLRDRMRRHVAANSSPSCFPELG